MTAKYCELSECWEFECDGFEFHIPGIPLNEGAFGWARVVSQVIRKLEPQIHARVMECIGDWPCDKTKAEILCVHLDDYESSKTVDVAFAGDESWGDFGVNVIITDGTIEDVYGGD